MIRHAGVEDFELLKMHEHCISEVDLLNSILSKRVLMMINNGTFIGWLRYNLFWDNTPFMNMLYILDEHRGKGFGKQLTAFWQNEMRILGFKSVMTSTLSNEQAQFFYRKLGYVDCGSLLLPDEPLEIIFLKKL